MTPIGVERMGDAADALRNPDMLRLENLDTDLPPSLPALELTAAEVHHDDANSYLPFFGHDRLRRAATRLVERNGGLPSEHYNWRKQCFISAGGLSGILNVLLALIDPGDEVVLTSPTYVGLINRVKLAGGVPCYVRMVPGPQGWCLDLESLRAALSPKTRAFLMMSPSMPSGAVFDQDEWQAICEACVSANAWMIYDSAMERILFEGEHMFKSKVLFVKSAVGLMSTAWMTSCAYVPASFSQQSVKLPFVTHAAFFSEESRQSVALDPQVFVQEANAPAEMGLQNIRHVAGYRNALISDGPSLKLFSASGEPLNFTLGEWLGAEGSVNLTPSDGGAEKVAVTFTGLKPGGVYSLFENHFDQQPVGFTPLDATGTANSFVAGSDGRGMLTVLAPQQLTHANAVLLVYHSDAKTYGASRGAIGVTAHHQLIV